MTLPTFHRPIFKTVVARLREPRKFIQALLGPRQVGKTTLIRQALQSSGVDFHYASADAPTPRDAAWIKTQWDVARLRAKEKKRSGAVLVLDEAQKVEGWSEIVKRLWDEDTASGAHLKVVLLGSAPLLVRQGLSESLAGRFEVVRVPHWSFAEISEAFGLGLDEYLYFGGYPGSASLISDEERWRHYILDALVETTLSRDILLQTRVDKPALLRHLFRLGCDYSGQILSYQKMLGQLHGAGNTTTLAHYLELLSGAGMLTGLQKYSGNRLRQRGSSPKLLVLNTALMTSGTEHSFATARANPDYWGRIVESAVGAHLLNGLAGTGIEVLYWREINREVDFVLKGKGRVTALEVTSSRRKDSLPGMAEFAKEFKPQRQLLVGGQGIPLEEFLATPPEKFVAA
ncbi:MAG: ATP-binding protein [Elusimicrobia bacterium]|nr:ATP-binding protein [Elusimicrobiota bacterium]